MRTNELFTCIKKGIKIHFDLIFMAQQLKIHSGPTIKHDQTKKSIIIKIKQNLINFHFCYKGNTLQ